MCCAQQCYKFAEKRRKNRRKSGWKLQLQLKLLFSFSSSLFYEIKRYGYKKMMIREWAFANALLFFATFSQRVSATTDCRGAAMREFFSFSPGWRREQREEARARDKAENVSVKFFKTMNEKLSASFQVYVATGHQHQYQLTAMPRRRERAGKWEENPLSLKLLSGFFFAENISSFLCDKPVARLTWNVLL